MTPLFAQLLTLLTTPPGNLTYHLVLAFTLAGTFQVSLSYWRGRAFAPGVRLITGLILLLLARLSLFLITLWAWQTATPVPEVSLAILDRAVNAVNLVLIVWLWVFPYKQRLADAATALLCLLIFTFAIFTYTWWVNQGTQAAFNGTLPDALWELLSLSLIFIGGLVLLARSPQGWGIGLVGLALFFAGHLTHLVAPLAGNNFPGAVRLAQMAAYPLLFFLPQRLPAFFRASESEPVVHERRRYGLDPGHFRSFLDLALETNPEIACQALARAISQAFLCDICLLVYPPDSRGQMVVKCGFDLVRGEPLEGLALDRGEIPLLASTLEAVQPLRLPAHSNALDLLGLGKALNLSRSGSVLAVPLVDADGTRAMGIVLISPHSQRDWDEDDEEYLRAILPGLSALLQSPSPAASNEEELSVAYQAVRQADVQINELRRQNQELLEQVNDLKKHTHSLTALIDAGEEHPAPLADKASVTAREHRLALEEIAHLRSALSQAQAAIRDLQERATKSTGTGYQQEAIAALGEELRQPLASIQGYCDVLLGETLGILVTRQRRLLERIRASVARTGKLLDDLTQISLTESGKESLPAGSLSLPELVENALAEIQAERLAKDIPIQMDIPAELPQILGDGQALYQILNKLLRNAIASTPTGGSISILARTEGHYAEEANVLLQVTDQGGGLSQESMAGIFSPTTRQVDAAVGITGGNTNDLWNLRPMVESQGGRVWVDSEPGVGCTFSLLLPISPRFESVSGA